MTRLHPQKQRKKIILVDFFSGNMCLQKVIYPLITQGSSVYGDFMDRTSAHAILDKCGGGHSLFLYDFNDGIMYLEIYGQTISTSTKV